MSYYEEDDDIYEDSEYEQYSDDEGDEEEEGDYRGGGFVAGKFKKGSKWTRADYKKMGVKKRKPSAKRTVKRVVIPEKIAKLSDKALLRTIARVAAKLGK